MSLEKKFFKYGLLALPLMAIGCAESSNESTNALIVNIDGGQKVRLEVIADDIIHVSATPNADFSTKESLITVPISEKVAFQRSDNDSTATISTASLSAVVNKHTGVVAFYNADGSLILSEDEGRYFEERVYDGKVDGLTFQQRWLPTPDEAFYGLGQHQADEFNYRGKNEELYQYNTKVSIPFIVSSRNYGILWDNYSLTRFGDKRDYAQLNEAFKVYDKNGNEGGLSSHWTPAPKSNAQPLDRTEPYLYFENLKANKELLPKDFPLQGAKVSFDGFLEPSETGTYRFLIYYAGYTRVFIDDVELFPEIWRTAWNPNSRKFSLDMEAGKKVKLHIDWQPDGGESYCALRALSPVPDAEQNKLSFWSQNGDQMDYYFINGKSMDDVISGYRTLTGKAQIMPNWAMGYWICRERYRTTEDILTVLNEFRSRHLPVDNIVQDWNYWEDDQWGSHEFDRARYPDPKAMIDSVHALDAHLMISVWPKFYINTDHYKEFDQKGWMYQQAVVDSIYDWIGYIGSFYDAYSADARKLFWDQMNEHLYSLGIDAWWMDASEPNVRDCTDIEYRKKLCGPTALGTSDKYFNAYALENAEAIYDGQRSVNDSSRVFLLTRSGFAGQQRYSTATWSGDIATRWEDMKAQISAGLNFAVSGVPFWTMDIGGFCVENRYMAAQQLYEAKGFVNDDLKEWRELQTRWFQFGMFCPLFRTHGQWPVREIYNLAPESDPLYKSQEFYLKLRYKLMPYVYSLNGMVHFNDYTIMRPLVMDYAADFDAVKNIGDQFSLGSSIMVAPVTTYKTRSRNVYLPAGQSWYDLYSGKTIAGGQNIEADAPYERIPAFIPAGAIIPLGADIESTRDHKGHDLTVFVYAGKNGNFTLYEDEGTNYNYEKGQCAFIDFAYDDAAHTLEISDRRGDFPGMAQSRNITVVLVSADNAIALDNTATGKTVEYNGTKTVVEL